MPGTSSTPLVSPPIEARQGIALGSSNFKPTLKHSSLLASRDPLRPSDATTSQPNKSPLNKPTSSQRKVADRLPHLWVINSFLSFPTDCSSTSDRILVSFSFVYPGRDPPAPRAPRCCSSEKMNSTFAAPVTYYDHFNDIAQYNVHLNVFEKAWAAWYAYMQNDVLATGIMSFVMHEVVYFGRCLPFMIMDKIPYFRKYKIQGAKMPTLAEQWACAKLVLLSHFTVELPQIWLFHPMAQYFGLSTTVPFPHWTKMAWQIALFFVLEDAWHYWFHRLLHTPRLYKMIHKLHHQYSAPFGLAAEYASPIETMILAFGTVGIPIVFCGFTKDLHIMTMYLWIVGRLFQAIDAHSGYEFPWSLHHFVPFWAGADHHDVHHEKFLGNYSSSFRWWDAVMDTEAGSVTAQKKKAKMTATTKKAE